MFDSSKPRSLLPDSLEVTLATKGSRSNVSFSSGIWYVSTVSLSDLWDRLDIQDTDGWAQDCGSPSVLAMELSQPCFEPRMEYILLNTNTVSLWFFLFWYHQLLVIPAINLPGLHTTLV